jgi:hypothetical protein
MAEEIAAATVRIIPDFTTFDAQVLAHAQASAKVIEGALAKVSVGGAGGAGAAAGLGGVAAATAPAVTGLDKVKQSSDKVDESFRRSSKSLSGFNTVAGQTGRLLIPIGVAFTVLAVKAVQSTSAIVEAVNAVNVAFGASSGEIQAFAKNLQQTDTFFGLTERAALDAAATFGLFFDDIVQSEPVLAALSEQLIKASADVGSLFNVETNKVLQDFTSGLQGQTRVVRKYGIDISAAATAQEGWRLGIAETGTELSEEEKRISRLSLMLHASAIAAGDAELTQNTFAGAVRNTQVALAGAINQLGQQLLPIAKTGVEAVGNLADGFGNLSGFSQRLIISFGLIATAAGPTLLIFSKLVPLFRAIVPAIQGFVLAVQTGTLALGPQIAILAAVTAAVLALKFALDAPSRAEQVGASFTELAKNAQELNKATGEGAELAKRYKASLEDLGLSGVDFRNFESIAAAIDTLNEKLAEGPPEKDRRGAGGIFGFTDALAGGINDFIDDFSETGIDIAKTVLGQDPAKSVNQIDTTAKVIEVLRAQIQAKNLTDAQALIASTKDAKVREQLQGVYDEENRLLAERTIRQKAANEETDRTIQAIIDQIDPTEKLNRLFAESVKNLEALLTVQTSVESAEKSLRSATTAAGNARDRLNRLLREGKVDLDKVKNAEDALIDVVNRRAEADREILRINKELAELQKGATADEIAEATDNVTKAEIALAKATRDRAAALAALEPRQRTSLNLQGLTLDQLRTLLANQRATLAAQRQSAAPSGAKTPEELAEDATLATIGVHDAERDLTEAREELTKVNGKGLESDQEVIDKRDELTRATVASTKAEREELDARKKLAEVKAGDPDFENKVAEARQAIADAGENAAGAAERLKEANIKLWEQEEILAGNVNATNTALAARLVLNRDLLQQQKDNDAFIRQFETLIHRSGIFPFGPGLPTTHDIAMSLINDPNSPFREVFKKLGIPFAEGGLVTSPTLGMLGERFKAESIIPWTKPDRVWEVLSKSLPHMPPVIRHRLEPVIPGHEISRPTHLNVPAAEFDYERMAKALAKAMREEGLGADVDIHLAPTPGMSESQFSRKVAREMGRFFGG